MKIFNQSNQSLRKKSPKKLGRGISAGSGKTAGRGTKGQKSRAGHNIPRQFEGGQTNLSMRLPKIKGFRGINRSCQIVTLDDLEMNYKDNDKVTRESLLKKRITRIGQDVKILANGTLTKKIYVEDIRLSSTAQKIIEEVRSNSIAPASKRKKTQ